MPLPGELVLKLQGKKAGRKTTGAQLSYYATWVEFGHKLPGGGYYQGKPFMRPAFDKAKNKAIQVMRKVMAKGIKDYRKG
jgi:HK97 gp10 family phage protein